jgi:hypothetical protein
MADVAKQRAFILSPARLDGVRGKLLLRPGGRFPLARGLDEKEGLALGEVFSFISALYFRGKLTYATAFAQLTREPAPVLVITTDRGLRPPEERVRRKDLARFSRIDIAAEDRRFLNPLLRDARALDASLGANGEVVLLGSIATGKYVDPLLSVFGPRLVFPVAFVGRGDMSRGGLLLRSARAGTELEYASVAGAVRHGVRPPRLQKLR